MEEGRNALRILTDKLTGKRPLGRPRMNLKEVVINMRNWINSAQDWDYWRTLVNVALNLTIA
jgi:hypothetical protein